MCLSLFFPSSLRLDPLISIPESLSPSPPPSLAYSLPNFLTVSLFHFLAYSLPYCLTSSLSHSLSSAPFVTISLTWYLGIQVEKFMSRWDDLIEKRIFLAQNDQCLYFFIGDVLLMSLLPLFHIIHRVPHSPTSSEIRSPMQYPHYRPLSPSRGCLYPF